MNTYNMSTHNSGFYACLYQKSHALLIILQPTFATKSMDTAKKSVETHLFISAS